jgi:hypothetical protein
MKKRILVVVLALILLVNIPVYGLGSIDIQIGDKLVEFGEKFGVPFIDENNRTQVPFRKTLETFGADVSWDSETREAVATYKDIEIRVPIGKEYIVKNGKRIVNDTKALIKDGRTYLPIRAVLEGLGSKVGWNNDTRTVVVDKPSDKEELFEGYTLIEVDGGDLSGHREPNVVVDIGFGDREYWSFTNEYGQVVKVIADEVILQDEENEDVLDSGRYYHDEARVPGTERKDLDQGHIIADSLGSVSSAYAITPQNYVLNRHGDQSYMEKTIRDAGGCKNFVAEITYPNTETQIPSYYKYTYEINGNVIIDEFPNVNPDEVNEPIIEEQKQSDEATTEEVTDPKIEIVKLDKKLEYIILKNISDKSVNLDGWKILSVRGEQSFIFEDFTLASGETVKVGDFARNEGIDFHWLDGRGTWNNTKSDPAELYNSNNQLVDRYND